MKAVSRTIALRIALAALSWLLTPDANRALVSMRSTVMSWLSLPDASGGLQPLQVAGGWLLLPAMAVWLMFAVAAALSARRILRMMFWAVTSGGWLAVLIFAQGRNEQGVPEEQFMLYVACSSAAVIACWLGWKARAAQSWRALGDTMAGIVVLATVLGGYAWAYEARTRAIVAQARARWAAIGLPMEEFEQMPAVGRENAGSGATRQVLREVVGTPFYRPAFWTNSDFPKELTEAREAGSRVTGVVSALPRADAFIFPSEAVAILDPFVAKLEAAYERMLAVEPPGWNSDPVDGPSMAEPECFGLHNFYQLAAT